VVGGVSTKSPGCILPGSDGAAGVLRPAPHVAPRSPGSAGENIRGSVSSTSFPGRQTAAHSKLGPAAPDIQWPTGVFWVDFSARIARDDRGKLALKRYAVVLYEQGHGAAVWLAA